MTITFRATATVPASEGGVDNNQPNRLCRRGFWRSVLWFVPQDVPQKALNEASLGDGWSLWVWCRHRTQNLLATAFLVWMHVKLLSEFCQRLFPADGCKRHLGLKSRAMVSAWSSRYDSSSLTAMMSLVSRNVTYPPCSDFPNHLSLQG